MEQIKAPPPTARGADRSYLERLTAKAARDERVRAVFLGGSHAAATADEHSDLDLYLITGNDDYESLRDERHDLLRSLGDAVFLEEHSDFGFLLLLYMYADGVHGEMALAPAKDLAAVHGGLHFVLVDKDGLLANREFPTGGLENGARKDLVRRLLVWFWYERRALDAALARGQLWTAHYHLERCRERCLDLAWLHAYPNVWPGGHEKAERMLDAATLAELAASVAPLAGEAMASAAGGVTDFYLEVAPSIAKECGVDLPHRLIETVTVRLQSGPR